MTVIHAELTAGHERMVLVAGGSELQVAQAAKQLKTLTPLFTKSDPPGALTVPATWPAVVQLQAAFGDSWRPGPRLCEWIEQQVAARTGTVQTSLYTPPSGLTPYPWQLEGAAMIGALGRVLITDEPGTGKTITTILGLVEWFARRELGQVGPVLVLCPASVVDPWVEAWQTWAPHVPAVAWRGAPAKRHALLGTAEVYVAGYETARMDAGSTRPRPLIDMAPLALVVDECHLVKNPHTERSRAARRLGALVQKSGGAVVALSGTPITHHPGDLWASLDVLEHDAWPSRERWVQRYCQTVAGDYRDEVLGLHPVTEPEFRLTLLGQHRRVAKADVLTQLPPKVYSVRSVDLPAVWRKAYDAMESQMLAQLPDGEELSVMSVLAQLTRLSQLACAAADVKVTTEQSEDGQEVEHVEVILKAPSWKVDALLEILEERRREDETCEPVVAFAPSRQLITLAGEAARKAGYRVGYVVGGQSMAERTATVAAFQAGELDLICVTTSAGGVGITLTAARTVVFLQRPWSLVESLQAEDRCHRIGSERHDSIEVIDVVARNTIDTRVRSVLRERAGQLADLVQDPRIVAGLLGGSGEPTTERKSA